MRLDGGDAELLDADSVRRLAPFPDFDNVGFPVRGGLLRRRNGTARHDACGHWRTPRVCERNGMVIG